MSDSDEILDRIVDAALQVNEAADRAVDRPRGWPNNQLELEHFALTPTGLVVKGTPTYEEWASIGALLRLLEQGVQFMIGDWIRVGEATFAEQASQVIDAEHFADESVRNFVWVSSKVPVENRRPDLSWSHHQHVASLPPPAQKTWLAKAAEGDAGTPWPSGRLKSEIKAAAGQETEVEYLLTVSFSNPADRDIVAGEHERIGRRIRKSEAVRPKEPQKP